jgi:hypothetical protein
MTAMTAKANHLKALLKKALTGRATAQQMRQGFSQSAGEAVIVIQVKPDLYDVGDKRGLTEAQMEEVTEGKITIFIIKPLTEPNES